MEDKCELKWLLWSEIQQLEPLRSPTFNFRVTAWPMPSNEIIPMRYGVYLYHKKQKEHH